MSDRIYNTVASANVKMLLFRPSGRKLWMVVGKDSEYWSDPELDFCSCKDFYFTTLSGGEPCYHLKSVKKAIEDGNAVMMEFADDEYSLVVQAIADDISGQLLR